MPLYLDTGFASAGGRTDDRPDSFLIQAPGGDEPIGHHGALLALADGLTERPDPEGAAADAIAALAASYSKTPESWPLERALRESFDLAHRKVLAGEERGRAAALSALVLRDRRWVSAHVGDTRVWRLRDGELKVLTQDHITPRVGRRYAVSQACGLDGGFGLDVDNGDLAAGDVYLLTSNAVHAALTGTQILSCLMADTSAQQMADCLTRQARAAGARGNVAAGAVRVEAVPEDENRSPDEALAQLPVIDPPQVGALIDGFRIEKLVHQSRLFYLYRAVDLDNEATVALKFPNPKLARSESFIDSFLHEEWIAKRVNNPHLVEPLVLKPGRRRALYCAMAYHRAENLSRRITRKGGLRTGEACLIMTQLLEALEQLHAEGVIHHDIRPKNLLYDKRKKQLLLMGLGSSYIHALGDKAVSMPAVQGSASYRAPELFAGAPPSVQTDVFAAGVTLYRMLTDHYPYGHIKGADDAPTGDMVPPTRYQPEIPTWLEDVLARACALNPAVRYQGAREFARAMTTTRTVHDSKPAPAPSTPTRTRASFRMWEWLAVGLLALGLAAYVMYALSAR
jgi:protein phosphatase